MSRWGEQVELQVAGDPERSTCPVCHEMRSEHGCSVDAGAYVGDKSYNHGRPTVHVAIYCHHPDVQINYERARRYTAIKPMSVADELAEHAS